MSIARFTDSQRMGMKIGGAVLLVAGLVIMGIGISKFSDPVVPDGSGPPPGFFMPVILFGAGGFVAIAGASLLRLGLRKQLVELLASDSGDAVEYVARRASAGWNAGQACAECRTPIEATDKFCSNCGGAIS